MARANPDNQTNLARLCVQTETLAMQFLSAGIEDMSTRTDGTDNTKTAETAAALQKLVDARFPNGSQLKQQL